MRTLGFGLSLAFACASVLVATGCGDDDRPGGGTDSGTTMLDAGGGGTDGGGGTTDGGGGTTDGGGGTTDGGGSTGMCPAGDCDLVAQTGCEAGQACFFLAPAAGESPAPTCDTSGTAGDGASCSTYRDCQEGFFCDSEAGICRHYCCMGSDVGCPTGQTCAVNLVGPGGEDTGVGFCKVGDTCDPVAQTGCDGTDGCYANSDGSVICIGSLSDLGEGEACEASNDCAPGLQCFSVGDAGPVCHKFCDTSDGSACGTDQTCQALSWPEPLDTLGLCTPAATP